MANNNARYESEIDTLADELIECVWDYLQRDPPDEQAAKVETSRRLREALPALWEWCSQEGEIVRLRTGLVNIAGTAVKWAVADRGDTPLAIVGQMARETLQMSQSQVDAEILKLKERKESEA